MATTSDARPATPRRRQKQTESGSGSQRRQELLNIAAEVFARRGFQSATVRDIGDAAGILSGSLYHHFRSKEQMLEELLRDYLDRLSAEYRDAATSDAPLSEVFAHMVLVGLRTVACDRPLAQLVHNDYAYLIEVEQFRFVGEQYRTIQKLWLDVIRRGQASGEFRKELKPESVFRVVMGALLAAIRWYGHEPSQKTDTIALEMTDVFLGGITAS